MTSIVIPLRSLSDGKTRLSPILSTHARESLTRAMFAHVLACARQVGPTFVVSRDPAACAMVGRYIVEQGRGLNEALEQAAREVDADQPLLALGADLPALTVDDLLAMLDRLASADVVIAPDRHGTGTNALLLARPCLMPYRFGVDSFAMHRQGARVRHLRFQVCQREGLANDVDDPLDLGALPNSGRTCTSGMLT